MQFDSYDTPDAQALLEARKERLSRQQRRPRELWVNGIAFLALLIADVLLAALAPWHGTLSVSRLALVLGLWVAVERVKFPVAAGWTYATVLVFIPALFVLPTPVVPLVALAAILLGAAPELVVGRTPVSLLPAMFVGGWFALGPALVIVLSGTSHFAWSHLPVYIGALAAQLVFDLIGSLAWSCLAEATSPRVLIPRLTWVYLVDIALAPLGLGIAALAVTRPGLMLLALSPTAMLLLLARERQQRLEHTVALSTAYRGTALLLGDVVEADDHYTGMHSRDVVDLSVAVAEALGLDANQRRDVEFAALLHDIGKIRVPKEIINKTDHLNASEWELVRRHTIEGEKMLKQVGGTLAGVGRIVRHSHEHYDGNGYPDGLAGAAIPIESRIVSACDAFSAMTTDRSYRRALTLPAALAELRRCAGTQFDPRVVEALDHLIRSQTPASELESPRRSSKGYSAVALLMSANRPPSRFAWGLSAKPETPGNRG